MADGSLLLEIKGTAKEFLDALDQIQSKSLNLEKQFELLGVVSGAAFALSAAEIGIATHAYGQQEEATIKLSQALQDQGIYSKDLVDKYRGQAEAIQKLTGVDAESIVQGQAKLQSIIGQTEVSEELTKATVDLAAFTGKDLNEAFQIVGKSANGHSRALNEMGLQIDDTATRSERLAQITEQLTQKFGGAAEAASGGVNGAFRLLKASAEELQKKIGEEFAPAINAGARAVATLFRELSENKVIVELIVSVVAGVAAFGALGLALAGAGLAFIKIKEAMELATIATRAMGIATSGLVAATGIGLLVILLTEIYLHWSDIWPRMHGIYVAFVDNVSSLSKGLGEVLSGVFTFDIAKVRKGLDDVKAALSKSLAEQSEMTAQFHAGQNQAEDVQNEYKAESAKKHQTELDLLDSYRIQKARASQALELLEAQQGSEEQIKLKKTEVELLTKLEDEKFKNIRGALQAHLTLVKALEEDARKTDEERERNYYDNILANQKQYQELSVEQQRLFQERYRQELIKNTETTETALQKFALSRTQLEQKNQNQRLLDEARFGKAYADINFFMHSAVIEQSTTAFANLESLTQSHNDTLKAIGKAAAITNITINTAKAALGMIAGFSEIPIIGEALGYAAAAAVIAYGGEQIGAVLAANQGGMVMGGIPGMDSVPALLTPGELVVPEKNFEETVGAVARQRAGQFGDAPEGQAQDRYVHIELSWKPGADSKLASLVEAKQIQNERLGLSLRRT